MSIELFEDALTGRPVSAEFDDGTYEALDVGRWLGPLDGADLALLGRLDGPTIDVGCGPGRLAAALTARGVESVGLDVAPGALRIALDRGARVIEGSVFAAVPGEGTWAHALLADGNIGIGGDPVRLLRRVSQLVRPGGRVHAEVGARGARNGHIHARLRSGDGVIGSWFPWAHVSSGAVEALAAAASLTVVRLWEECGRCFAELSS